LIPLSGFYCIKIQAYNVQCDAVDPAEPKGFGKLLELHEEVFSIEREVDGQHCSDLRILNAQ
jgi:hypothetical protein